MTDSGHASSRAATWRILRHALLPVVQPATCRSRSPTVLTAATRRSCPSGRGYSACIFPREFCRLTILATVPKILVQVRILTVRR